MQWDIFPPDGVFEGVGFGDGSGLKPVHPRARRCGWGLTVYSVGHGIVAELHGALPGWLQEVPIAESYALLMYLTHIGIHDPEFVTDCKFVVDTFAKGPEASSHGGFLCPHVWRRIWTRVRDIGRDRIIVRWVPAHCSSKHV